MTSAQQESSDDVDFERMKVVGTSKNLEKKYFRLTSVCFIEAVSFLWIMCPSDGEHKSCAPYNSSIFGVVVLIYVMFPSEVNATLGMYLTSQDNAKTMPPRKSRKS